MPRQARKWVIGLTGALLVAIAGLLGGDGSETLPYALVFGLCCGVLAALPQKLAIGIAAPLAAIGILGGYRREHNPSDFGGVADAMALGLGLAVGAALVIAILGNWILALAWPDGPAEPEA